MAVLVAAGALAGDMPRLNLKPGIWKFDHKTQTRIRENGSETSTENSRTTGQKISNRERGVDILLTPYLSSQADPHCHYLYLTATPQRIRAEYLCDYQLDSGPLGGRTFSDRIELAADSENTFTADRVVTQSVHGAWVLIEHETVRGNWVSEHR